MKTLTKKAAAEMAEYADFIYDLYKQAADDCGISKKDLDEHLRKQAGVILSLLSAPSSKSVVNVKLKNKNHETRNRRTQTDH